MTLRAVASSSASFASATFPPWISGGGAGPAGSYNADQTVSYNGGFYVSLVSGNTDTPPSAKWQSFAMNDVGV